MSKFYFFGNGTSSQNCQKCVTVCDFFIKYASFKHSEAHKKLQLKVMEQLKVKKHI